MARIRIPIALLAPVACPIFALGQDGGASTAPSPPLPLPDWRDVPSVSLVPPVPAGAGEPGAAAWLPPSTGGLSGDRPPALPPAGELTSPEDLQRYIDSLPALEEVPEFAPAGGPGRAVAEAAPGGLAAFAWHRNPREARRAAAEQGKYFLLAFVGLGWQPLSNALNDDVFNSQEFAAFGAEHLVAAYLDFAQSPSKNHPVYERFKEFCGVKGFPATALFSPDGVHLETFNGYNQKAGAEAYFLRLKDRVTADRYRLDREAKKRRELEASGFRTWHNSEGKTVLARLRALRGGKVFFEHPDGRRTAAPIETLAFVDREIARRTAPAGK